MTRNNISRSFHWSSLSRLEEDKRWNQIQRREVRCISHYRFPLCRAAKLLIAADTRTPTAEERGGGFNGWQCGLHTSISCAVLTRWKHRSLSVRRILWDEKKEFTFWAPNEQKELQESAGCHLISDSHVHGANHWAIQTLGFVSFLFPSLLTWGHASSSYLSRLFSVLL